MDKNKLPVLNCCVSTVTRNKHNTSLLLKWDVVRRERTRGRVAPSVQDCLMPRITLDDVVVIKTDAQKSVYRKNRRLVCLKSALNNNNKVLGR
eukprot:scaffold1522_cov166-Amphora_coffeaeformis.AAC.9